MQDKSAPTVPAIGIDPGARWTGAVLRVGDRPVTGWTLGPLGADGRQAYTALDNVDDLQAMSRYLARLRAAVAELEKRAEEEFGVKPVVALEAIVVPFYWKANRPGRQAIKDWLIPRQVAVGLLAVYPDAVLVSPDTTGPISEYPEQLRRTPPIDWGLVESRRRERDHERAAYDVAGVAIELYTPPVVAA